MYLDAPYLEWTAENDLMTENLRICIYFPDFKENRRLWIVAVDLTS